MPTAVRARSGSALGETSGTDAALRRGVSFQSPKEEPISHVKTPRPDPCCLSIEPSEHGLAVHGPGFTVWDGDGEHALAWAEVLRRAQRGQLATAEVR